MDEFSGSGFGFIKAGCGRGFDEAEDASAARARPFTPYEELSTRRIISHARGS
jgi:hypothetical protein